jgi:uncharacterized protein
VSLERVVLDTNVLVSALLNSFGAPGRVLDLALAGELTVAYDDRVLAEWRQVLHREKFDFPAGDIEVLLGFVEGEGISVNASPLGVKLPDQDDLLFLEVAHAAEATLITGNTRHYPLEGRRGVAVLDPTSFLDEWTSKVLQQE